MSARAGHGGAATRGAALAVALALAGCGAEPAPDAASFAGGVLSVSGPGAGLTVFVNPDGSLAGAEGAEVEDFRLTRSGLRFTAVPEGAAPVAFDMAAAPVGPDYAGTYAIGGDCRAECSGEATAWWAQGHERVAPPQG